MIRDAVGNLPLRGGAPLSDVGPRATINYTYPSSRAKAAVPSLMKHSPASQVEFSRYAACISGIPLGSATRREGKNEESLSCPPCWNIHVPSPF